MRNSCVLDTVFDDVDGVVFEVVVENALANAVVFVGVFNDGLLEVSFEIENLKELNRGRL